MIFIAYMNKQFRGGNDNWEEINEKAERQQMEGARARLRCW